MNKKILSLITAITLTATAITQLPVTTSAANDVTQMEYLDRGTVAVKVTNGVYLSWRLLGTENYDTAFDVYRGTTKIATVSDSTNYTDTSGKASNTYTVVPKGESRTSGNAVTVLSNQYMSIPLEAPAGGTSLDGEEYTYTANDAECADLDGDGEYEIILKWNPSNAFDSGKDAKHTGNVYIDAYKLNGTRLWRMDLGINISAGAHFTQIAAYDFDLDGKAEIAFKTAPGTKDGQGNYVSAASRVADIKNTDNTADYRHTEGGTDDTNGRVLSGDEYYTVFQGDTGAALDTIYYPHPRGTIREWGDNWGNRSERYLTAVAYLDGIRPSMIAWRGYYAKTTATAYNLVNKKLVQVADFDSSVSGYEQYGGQGNHNTTVGDVDGDGKDEIFCGSLALDDDLTPLWTSSRGHGDALHLADYDPSHEGMEYFTVHESEPYGMTLHDAATGEELFHQDAGGDTGRGMMAHVGYTDGYFELWGAGNYASYGGDTVIRSNYRPDSTNFRIFWDGDLYDDLLDGTGSDESPIKINNKSGRITTLPNGVTNNSTKNNPCLTADLFGDWREEIVVRSSDGNSLLIYTTTIPTTNKLYTLMHDRAYRMQVAGQNSAYNQPPHIGYYMSDDNDEYDCRKYSSYVKTVHNGTESVRTANLPNEKPSVKASPKPTPTAAPTPTPKPTDTPEPTATPTPTPEIKQFVVEDGVLIGYNGTDKNITIPNTYDGQTITAISPDAFSYNSDIESVIIPDTVTDVQEYAFTECVSLTSVKLPKNITEIKDGTFEDCTNLENITWPQTVKKIGTGAFSSCRSLKSIKTEDCEEIGRAAFYWCDNVKEITLKGKIAETRQLLWGCSRLEKVIVDSRDIDLSDAFDDINSDMAIYGYAGSPAQFYADSNDVPFYDLETGKRITTEWVVDNDGVLVKYNGDDLNITVPSEVNGKPITAIGERTFAYTDIKSITLPESIEEIYYDAFRSCKWLKRIVLSNGITHLNDAFTLCSRLEYIYIPPTVTEFENDIFGSSFDLTIYGEAGSKAEEYANENNIPFYTLGKYGDLSMNFESGKLHITNNTERAAEAVLYTAKYENNALREIHKEKIEVPEEGFVSDIYTDTGMTFFLWSVDFVPLADKCTT